MKKPQDTKQTRFLTRTELINSSRSSNARDKLPNICEGMFDILPNFKQGTREFVNLSKTDKS